MVLCLLTLAASLFGSETYTQSRIAAFEHLAQQVGKQLSQGKAPDSDLYADTNQSDH